MPYKDKAKQKAAQQRYYQESKPLYTKKSQNRRNRFRKIIDDTKSNIPCMDCGIDYPSYVMDFDHRPGTIKLNAVSAIRRFSSEIKLLEEIVKCDLVCANCHRHRTWMRKITPGH